MVIFYPHPLRFNQHFGSEQHCNYNESQKMSQIQATLLGNNFISLFKKSFYEYPQKNGREFPFFPKFFRLCYRDFNLRYNVFSEMTYQKGGRDTLSKSNFNPGDCRGNYRESRDCSASCRCRRGWAGRNNAFWGNPLIWNLVGYSFPQFRGNLYAAGAAL
jgi:hypothetical protein